MSLQSENPTPNGDFVAAPGPVTDSHPIADVELTAEVSGTKRKGDDDHYDPGSSSSPKRHESENRRITRSQTKDNKTREVGESLPKRTMTAAEKAAERIASLHDHKPAPSSQPPVWTDKRAALNDALPYFKSHQGSLYTTGLMPKGMFIDSQVAIRDHFSSQVIITTIGGGHDLDQKTGKMVRNRDQKDDMTNVKAMKQAKEANQPFVMIAGSLNTLWPVRPPHYFNVLDYFYITDLWSEVVKGDKGQLTKVYKIRVEKVDLNSSSWWSPKDTNTDIFKVGDCQCTSAVCPTCYVRSKEIFTRSWACLNNKCAHFFDFGQALDVDELEYNDAFINERNEFTGTPPQEPLLPPLPSNSGDDLGSESKYKQGIVCPKCFCCSRRISWDKWFCENPDCEFQYEVPIRMVPIDNVMKENRQVKESKSKNSEDWNDEAVLQSNSVVGGYSLVTYLMPDAEHSGSFLGSVTRIRPNDDAREKEGGLDNLYTQLQKEDMPLLRRPAKSSGCRIEELTSHFSANYGAPYKFGVVVKQTTGFSDAPVPIVETLLRLTWAGQTAVDATAKTIVAKEATATEGAIPTDFEPYNEQLVLGYFEKSKISAHDDGEKELGPSVATLSLGSPSVMKFMPKPTRDKDRNKQTYPPILSLVLKHGDMLVMHGQKIQKQYLHSVDPFGKHRFALTCRYIRPETIPDDEQRALAVVRGKLPEKLAAIQYNGESDHFEDKVTGMAVPSPTAPEKTSEDESSLSTETEAVESSSPDSSSTAISTPEAAELDVVVQSVFSYIKQIGALLEANKDVVGSMTPEQRQITAEICRKVDTEVSKVQGE
ncbi:hypothetical protein GGR54DRAFT_649065 [Hypoxylon sp. NC1633]|nr:hypothetical protein GGR54DRAFT_649065 [Hypoxylon sp. NC1633]